MILKPKEFSSSIAVFAAIFSILSVLTSNSKSTAGEFEIGGYRFTLPDGFTIEKVAPPSLIERPISASFDEAGNLYVTESSGTNDPSAKQLEDKPHRVLRLTDSNGDGVYDLRTIYAEGLMFPEGALFHDGSLYVAAPPSIWKFTDADGDGISDSREEWLNAKTLTGCANDLHGPYLGPDGWIYWCKGAFAEQTYERPGKSPFVTRASHIFRRRAEGGVIEPVMTGGMDNPVEVAFSNTGERFFTTTFLVHPGQGQRDGIIHAIYGGVYGKNHGVLDGHPRTGDLMPPLVHLGAAASSGLMRMQSAEFGGDYRDNLFASSFNMHKITRHELIPDGAMFKTRDHDFLVCDSFDFHPTDVLEDADGSLLVVDTGGWYKLCCPTSQLHKPEIIGGIYRVRRSGAHKIADPRGDEIDWEELTSKSLCDLLADDRPAVRSRAVERLAKIGAGAVADLKPAFEKADKTEDVQHQLEIVWTLSHIGGAQAAQIVRDALQSESAEVKMAAAHAISVARDAKALDALCRLLKDESGAVRRVAAEALGRLENKGAIAPLLAAANADNDRVLQHSLTYALIEIDDAQATVAGLLAENPASVSNALIALDQMEHGNLQPEQVAKLFNSPHDTVRRTAAWVVMRRADWGSALSPLLQKYASRSDLKENDLAELQQMLARFSSEESGQKLIASLLQSKEVTTGAKQAVLQAVLDSAVKVAPASWIVALDYTNHESMKIVSLATQILAKYSFSGADEKQIAARLEVVANNKAVPSETRLHALQALPDSLLRLDGDLFSFVKATALTGNGATVRGAAAQVLKRAPLDALQLQSLIEALPEIGPLEIEPVLSAFAKTKEERIGTALVAALKQTPAAESLDRDKLKASISHFGDSIRQQLEEHFQQVTQSKQEQFAALEQRLNRLPSGDPVAGQKIFMSPTAACAACHAVGYLGGRVGPDLTRIGNIRQPRDLMESILYPSASFVRGFEPLLVSTVDGKSFNGFLKEDNDREVVLMNAERQEVHIPREDIEEMGAGTLSIMPAGLDKQLTDQQLADLLEFLKTAK